MASSRSLTFSGSVEGPVGRCSDVAIYDDVAVMVYDKTLDTALYWQVGTVDKTSNRTKYDHEKIYDKGKMPSVTLIRYSGIYYAIATHQPDNYSSRTCYYHIGTVDVENKEITFLRTAQEFQCAALKLKVSASDNGIVVIAHEKYYSYSTLCYHIGTLNPKTLKLDGIAKCEEIASLSGVQPSLDIHDNTVVMVYLSRFQCELKSVVGTIDEDKKTIVWGKEVSLINDINGIASSISGIYPSISVNAHGDVVESHQSKFFRRIMRVWGKVRGQEIVWTPTSLTAATFGEYPTLSLADDGYFIEAHKTNFGLNLYLSDGKLS